MKKLIGGLIVLMMLVTPASVQAASPWTEADTYSDQISQKLEFGLKNTLLGWLEIFNEPAKAADAGENWISGVPKGLGDFIINTVGGAVHLVTFPIPIDVPLPDNGVDI